MSATYTRRDVLRKGGMAVAAGAALPLVGRVGYAIGDARPDPSTARRNRLVLIYLAGGNDGLNTVVPAGDIPGAPRRTVYDKVRPTLAYPTDVLLPLNRGDDADHRLGLNPSLSNLHRLYDDGRLAVVQGVDYPNHSYSHFNSTDIWGSGQPDTSPDTGWLGRHIDRVGVADGELRAVAVDPTLPLALRGRDTQGTKIRSLPLRYGDGSSSIHEARHRAIRRFGDYPEQEVLRHLAGRNAAAAVGMADRSGDEEAPTGTGSRLANALLAGRVLLEGDYGCEIIHVTAGGFDNHAAQRGIHEARLTDLDYAINTFLNGDPGKGVAPMDSAVASRTLIMTYSEFGRRIGQNGSAGTDHGAAAPLFLVGPSEGRLVGGLHGDHPDMGTAALPADNLALTTDLGSLYQTVLTDWLGSPDPDYDATLSGLFTPA